MASSVERELFRAWGREYRIEPSVHVLNLQVPSLGRVTIGWDGRGRDGWAARGANGSEEVGNDGSREEPGAEGCKGCIEGEVAHGFRGLEQICSPR